MVRKMLNELQGKGLLIHHWDTDGICSARLILKHLSDKDIRNVTPTLGNYFLTDQELKEYSNYDFVIVVDMSLPEENILKLAKNAKVLIFDHHLGKEIKQVFHHNPVIKGKDPDKYPSASWIVNLFLEKQVNLYAILGIVGDHEKKIKKNKDIFKIINDFCKNNNLEFDELLKMTYLLDTNYKLGDKKAVEEAPIKLLRFDSPDDILHNDEWNQNYEKLNKEIQINLDLPYEEKNNIIYKKIDTSYNIISTITRKIAWSSGKDTLVVNTGFFNDKDQIYMRSKKNTEPMIKRGKELGFKCGGKKEVLGAIVPKDKTNSFVEELLEFMK
jgi:single-stranded DNA-specific DHH superfamily exonuclease